MIANIQQKGREYQMRSYDPVKHQCVGNKAGRRISKRVFQENKASQIFRKKNIFYPLIRTRTYQGVTNATLIFKRVLNTSPGVNTTNKK